MLGMDVLQDPVSDESYEIRTPENVRFHFERAGIASRALAWTLDVVAMGLLIQAAAVALSLSGVVLGDLATALLLVVIFLVQWWYGAISEWLLSGRTLGKWALGLRTIDAFGLPLSLYQSTIRNLLRVVDFLPGLYLVGGATALLDPLGRRLGDIAASTLVIRDGQRRLPARLLLEVDVATGPRPDVQQAAARLSPTERAAVLSLCARRDSLPLGVRAELFDELATHLVQRHGLGRAGHLSAEKLVLYVASALSTRPVRGAGGGPRRLGWRSPV